MGAKPVAACLVAVSLLCGPLLIYEGTAEKAKPFLYGLTKEQIQLHIQDFSMGPMLALADAHGIDIVGEKKVPSLDSGTTAAGSSAKISSSQDVYIAKDEVLSEAEPSIAAHPLNSKLVLAFYFSFIETGGPRFPTCYIKSSTDGGLSWSEPIKMPLLSSTDVCFDPVIRWAPGDGADSDSNVRAYAIYMSATSTLSTASVVMSHSDDNGKTWSDPVVVFAGIESDTYMDKPWFTTGYNFPSPSGTADNDKVFAVSMYFDIRRHGPPGQEVVVSCQVVFSKSSDGGETFPDPYSPKVIYESEDCVFPMIRGPTIAYSSDDTLLSCWWHDEDGVTLSTFDIRCKTSLDAGNTFGSEAVIANDVGELTHFKCPAESYHWVRAAMYPMIEISSDGVAHMVYTADPTPFEDSDGECGDIFYAKSSDTTFEEWTPSGSHLRVNDDSTATFQGYPTISSKKIRNENIIVVAWEDDRNSESLGSPNLIYDVYATTIDSDSKIQPNKRLTDISSLSDFEFIGDYFSSSVPRDGKGSAIAYVIWTDRRDKTDIFDFEDDVMVDKFKLGT